MTYLAEFPKLGLSFELNPVAFAVGDFQIRWYGIILALGFVCGLLYAFSSLKRMNINSDKFFDVVLVGTIGAIIGARIYYVLFYYPLNEFFSVILNIRDGGLAFYGSLIGALACGMIMAKVKKLNVFAVLDVASLGFLIGQAIGRWGNFVNQEAFGTVTDLPWGMSSQNTNGLIVHPCFLYESLLCAIGFLLLHIFTKKFRRYDGQTFLLYILWYGAIRFLIEGLRTDSLFFNFFGAELRISQVLAGLTALLAIVLLIAFRNRTVLSGCGSSAAIEAHGLILGSAEEDSSKKAKKEKKEKNEDNSSTIFGDVDKKLDLEEITLDEDTEENTSSDSKNADE